MLNLGTRICLMGDWDSSPVPAGRVVVRLVPQKLDFAFGNGWKPSTQAFLADLENLVKPGMSVIDLGTGVGVLAVAVVRLGAAKVVAVEPGDIGLRYCRQNLEVNGVADQVQVIQGWFPIPIPAADLVLCNIDELAVLTEVLDANLAPQVAIMPDQAEVYELTAYATQTGYRVSKSEPVRDYQYMVLVKD